MDFVITEKIKAEPGRRFINYILDLILRCFVFFILLTVIGVIGRLEYEWTTNSFILEWLQQLNFWRGYFVWLIGSFLYYFITEIFISRSIAKFVTGTIVVSNDGSKPKIMAILKRSLIRFIPIIDFVSFLYVKGLHDSVSDTFVVKKILFEETKTLFNSFKELGTTESN